MLQNSTKEEQQHAVCPNKMKQKNPKFLYIQKTDQKIAKVIPFVVEIWNLYDSPNIRARKYEKKNRRGEGLLDFHTS